ncbi:MAG TPA: sulfite exporter TauE/SafE family protein [Burkholderiales bacterium]|nr:sulfite exporter TauE/SafE family protein [Burkholderiales bacterium]
MDWIYPLSGLIIGFIVGLTGVGGGSLMTPLLVLVFGVAPAVAVGTDLLYAAITKCGGILAHGRRGNVDWQIVGRLAAGSVPAALLTTWVLHQFDVNAPAVAVVIKATLGAALLLTALALVFRARLADWSRERQWIKPHQIAPATVAVGAVLGVLVTISSVGAGAIGVAALFFLYPNLPTLRIVGSDIAHAVPLTLVAGLGHATLGTVNYHLLGLLLIGSLPGIWIGSHLSSAIPERWLRGALITMLVVVGGRLVII